MMNGGGTHDPPPKFIGEFDGVKIWHMHSIVKNQTKLDLLITEGYGRLKEKEDEYNRKLKAKKDYDNWEANKYQKKFH